MSQACSSESQHHIVVIGSGFGGAIAAARLAEAGFKVTLVERGPWRDSLPVRSMGIQNRAPLPVGRHLFSTALRSLRTRWGNFKLNKNGLLEFYLSANLNIINASGVGGGSHAYGSLNMRPVDPAYWHKAGLDSASMERHYQTVAAKLGSQLPPLAQMRNPAKHLWPGSPLLMDDQQVCALPMGMLFPETLTETRAETSSQPTTVSHDGIQRQASRPGHDGTFGSPSGAKTSLDFAYLHAAIRDHNLTVLDLTEAQLIRRQCDSADARYSIQTRDLRTGQRQELTADTVFVAAGTLNTLELLLRSCQTAGLNDMPHLGKNFYANGDLAFSCKLPPGKTTQMSIPIDGAVRCHAELQPLNGRPWPFLIINTLPLADMPLPQFLKRKMQQSLVLAGMGADAPGRARLLKNRLTIDYDPQQSLIYDDLRQAAAMIAAELGGTLSGGERPTSAHPMGGACLCPNASTGVIDLNGEVYGNTGLYITDAAALPMPIGGPPSLSIGAWAEHVAATFISRNPISKT